MTHHPLQNKPASGQPKTGYRWWVVFMLWWVCFFNYADRQAISAVLPVLEKEFGFNKQELGYISSAFMWVYAAAAPLAGYVGDRVRRKDLILGGCLFWSFVTITTGWCSKLWHFITVRALEGFGETFYFPASMSLVSDYHSRATRSRAMSFHQSSVYVGTIMGSWLGALFAQHYGWQVGFYVFGTAGIVLAVVLYKLLREPVRGAADGPLPEKPAPTKSIPYRETLKLIFKKREVAWLMIAFAGANFVATIFLTWTPTFLYEKFQYKLAAAGLNGALFIQVSSAVSVPLSGLLADKLSARFPGGRMLVQAAGLLVGASFVAGVGLAETRHSLMLAMIAFGLCKGIYDANIFASVYDVVPSEARASAAGLMNTIGWIGGSLGPIYVGWMALHGTWGSEIANMSHAIAWGGAVYLVSGIILLIVGLRVNKIQAILSPTSVT